jgi:hypothetical protein
MHYALPAWMFKRGKSSRCYVSGPRALSRVDRATILDAYPATVALQDNELQKRASITAAVMGSLDLNATQLAMAGVKIAQSLRHHHRKMNLQFALGPNGVVLRSGEAMLSPCDGESVRMAALPSIRCGVAPDGSSLVIEIDPPARRQ